MAKERSACRGFSECSPAKIVRPTDKVRHVDEAIAMVVAETKTQALDGAE